MLRNNNLLLSSGDASLGGRLFVKADASLNGNLTVGGNLVVNGNLTVKEFTQSSIINTITTNVFSVSEDLSLNGRLLLYGDASLNGRVFAQGDASLNGRLYVSGNTTLANGLTVTTGTTSLPATTLTGLLTANSGLTVNYASNYTTAVLSSNGFAVGNSGTADVTRHSMLYMSRVGTATVQNNVSAAINLGSNTATTNGISTLDFKLASFPGSTNNYGFNPDTNVMTLVGNGNVGIGTTNPNNTLTVNGALTGALSGINSGQMFNFSKVSAANTWYKIASMSDTQTKCTFRISGVIGCADNSAYNINVTLTANNIMSDMYPKIDYETTFYGGTLWNNFGIVYVQDSNNGRSVLYIKTLVSGIQINLNIVAASKNTGSTYTPTFYENTSYSLSFTGTISNSVDSTLGSTSVTNYDAYSSANLKIRHWNENGNVGIGTTSPVYPLAVNGTLRINTTDSTNNKLLVFWDGSPSESLTTGTNFYGFGLNSGMLRYQCPGACHAFFVDTTEKMRINSTGVGIGTTNPAYTLDVSAASTAPLRVGVGSTNALVVNSSGNVGIGTTTPAYKLDIRTSNLSATAGTTYSQNMIIATDYSTNGTYSITVGGFLQGGTVANQSTFLALGTCSGSQASSLSEKMRIVDSGCVGIGTTNPKCQLHVVGNTNLSQSGVTASFANPGENYFSSYANPNIYPSIVASGWISACGILNTNSSTYAASDRRIKTNICSIVDNTALCELRKLQPRLYNYIDTFNNGTDFYYGFIAQEVAEIMPASIKKIKNKIPNIYCNASIIYNENGSIITLESDSIKTSQFDISYNPFTVILYDDSNNEITGTINRIIDDRSFQIKECIQFTKIFVYGQEVDDFLTIEKDSIFTITTAALQQIDREFQEAKQTIQTLESENADLKAKFASLDARLSAAGF